jgi:dolichyl-phosphate beta-glucosyltransferase
MSTYCIVVPCYNEETRLPVAEFADSILNSDFSFCFVNDGSTDKTIKVLANLQECNKEKVHVLDLKINQGKAEAVRSGFNYLIENFNYDFIGYLDADLATPISEIETLKSSFLFSENLQFVFGSRIKLLGRNIERTVFRHYMGRVFATAASTILSLPVYDTQCGAKLIRTGLARKIFNEPFISPWLFDIELFARCIKIYGRKEIFNVLLEIPLYQWLEKGDSRIKAKHLARIPIELLKIYQKY